MVDTLKAYKHHGYMLARNHHVPLLQYADDTCILANSPATCQFLLSKIEVWFQWAGMKAKVLKCHSLAFKSSSAEPVDPKLELSGQPIPFIGNKDIQFLGMTVQVPRDRVGAKQKLGGEAGYHASVS